MNYDSSISTEVSLSKILDESIMDDTDSEIVQTFLKSHEQSIGEIFKQAAFAYDLYDLGVHAYKDNPFLLKHIPELHPVDKCFAASILASTVLELGERGKLVELKDIMRGDSDMMNFLRAGWQGHRIDREVISGETDLVEYLENLMNDQRDMRSFLSTSHLARSVFMASTFLNLTPGCQFAVLMGLKSAVDELHGRHWDESVKVYGHFVCSLLKQLLLLNETTLFNWVEKVIGISNNLNHFIEVVLEEFRRNIPVSIAQMMPRENVFFRPEKESASFEEVVFEMNMLLSEFEPCDLFLYIYLGGNKLFKGMKENSELLEFFSLPFDWNKLDNFMK